MRSMPDRRQRRSSDCWPARDNPLARGLAPLVLDLPALPPAIALGGFLKSAAAWSNGNQSVLGPHIGDQQSLPARQRFLDHLDDMQRLYRFCAELLIHDMHPEYFSTQWAKSRESKLSPFNTTMLTLRPGCLNMAGLTARY